MGMFVPKIKYVGKGTYEIIAREFGFIRSSRANIGKLTVTNDFANQCLVAKTSAKQSWYWLLKMVTMVMVSVYLFLNHEIHGLQLLALFSLFIFVIWGGIKAWRSIENDWRQDVIKAFIVSWEDLHRKG